MQTISAAERGSVGRLNAPGSRPAAAAHSRASLVAPRRRCAAAAAHTRRCRRTTTPQPAAPWPLLAPRCRQLLPPAQAAAGPGGGFDMVNSMVAALRADPQLAPLLDNPRVAAAVKEVASNPAALAKYAGDRKVMAVLGRLLEKDLPAMQAAEFCEMGTTPRGALQSMAADPELVALLATPKVKQALSDIKADPEGGMARWAGDAEVSRALDPLEGALGGGGGAAGGGVIDVTAQPPGGGA